MRVRIDTQCPDFPSQSSKLLPMTQYITNPLGAVMFNPNSLTSQFSGSPCIPSSQRHRSGVPRSVGMWRVRVHHLNQKKIPKALQVTGFPYTLPKHFWDLFEASPIDALFIPFVLKIIS